MNGMCDRVEFTTRAVDRDTAPLDRDEFHDDDDDLLRDLGREMRPGIERRRREGILSRRRGGRGEANSALRSGGQPIGSGYLDGRPASNFSVCLVCIPLRRDYMSRVDGLKESQVREMQDEERRENQTRVVYRSSLDEEYRHGILLRKRPHGIAESSKEGGGGRNGRPKVLKPGLIKLARSKVAHNQQQG